VGDRAPVALRAATYVPNEADDSLLSDEIVKSPDRTCHTSTLEISTTYARFGDPRHGPAPVCLASDAVQPRAGTKKGARGTKIELSGPAFPASRRRKHPAMQEFSAPCSRLVGAGGAQVANPVERLPLEHPSLSTLHAILTHLDLGRVTPGKSGERTVNN
jgi:hypothetical protein